MRRKYTRSRALFRQRGAAAGVLMPVGQAILYESFPPDKRGSSMAVFGLGVMVGPAIGPLRIDSAHRSAPHAEDYDRLENYKHPATGWLDTMWVGYDARYNAIREVSRSIRYIDSVVGWNSLVYAQEQMSVRYPEPWSSDRPGVNTRLRRG